MSLSEGTRLGSYEITNQIGAGGMGEVYRATDTKLGRDVAIKILPAALASDSERLARFEREAKLLAALNHPHIASVHSLDEHEGTLYLAMELVEGETLEEKLKAGALPVEDALRLALQIAEALEAAHGKGVVHRDLKPANVMVAGDGIVKVLDFGLAKAFTEDAKQTNLGQSPALSVAMTQQGLVLGTAGYMSPEQASGQPTDQRADIWSFGVVLYEMLTGLPLFSGESVPHILADVLKTEPDWNRLPKGLHPRLRLMLERCLEKKRRNRYHSIADVRVDIEKVLSDPRGILADLGEQGLGHLPRSFGARFAMAAGLVVIGVGVTSFAAWLLWPVSPPQPVTKFSYVIPDSAPLRGTLVRVLALSPDGRRFVYNGEGGVYLREMNALDARLIPGTEGFLGQPFFAPDSESIGYWNAEPFSLRRIGINGGASVPVANLGDSQIPLGQSWHTDGMIYYGLAEGLFRVPATGGEPELLIEAGGGELLYGPTLLPDGDSLLFSVSDDTSWDSGRIVVESLSTAVRKTLITGGNDARYIPTGHIVYAFEDDLFGVAFDLDTLSVSGGAVPLAEEVMRAEQTADANYGISGDGTLIYLTGVTSSQGDALVWVDREGNEELLDAPIRPYRNPRISPDGRRLAVTIAENLTDQDIWIYDLIRGGAPSRITFAPEIEFRPVWMPDNERVVYWSDRDGGGLFRRSADGTGSEERLTTAPATTQIPEVVTTDGLTILLHTSDRGAHDLHSLSLSDGSELQSEALLADPGYAEGFLSLSPDGRYLAYTSTETGRAEVYVRPYPNVHDRRWTVSTNGGAEPLWAPDGRELFYRLGDSAMAVSVEEGPVFGEPQLLFEFESEYLWNGSVSAPNWDIHPDGQRFLLIKTDPVDEIAPSIPKIVVVQNWFEELKRLVPIE